jgi:hypothetical protein
MDRVCYFVRRTAMHTLRTLIPILFIFLIGCSRSQSDLSPDDRKLAPVHTDLLLLKEEFSQPASGLDSASYQQRLQQIFSKAGITQEEFSQRLTTLARSQEAFQQFQTLVALEVEKRKSRKAN